MSIIDVATHTVTGYVNNGGFPFTNPTIVTVISNTKAYVSNSNGNNVSIIDLTTNTVTGYIAHVFGVPINIVLSNDGSKVYITDLSLNQVIIVNAVTDAVIGTFTGTFSGPLGFVESLDSLHAYVGNTTNDTVSVIDLTTNTQTGIINDALAPFFVPYQLAIAPIPFAQTLPPAGLTGRQQTNRFATQSELFNTIKWLPGPSGQIVRYNVYRNGVLIGTVLSGSPLIFEDHNMPECMSFIYGVTAVNDLHFESAPITISLP